MSDDNLDDLFDELEAVDEDELGIIDSAPEPEPESEIDEEPITTLPIEQEPEKISEISDDRDDPLVSLNLGKIMKSHEKDYDLAMDYISTDRARIVNAVTMLQEKIAEGTARSTEVTALAQLLSSLSDSSGNVVRLMGERTKLVSVVKGYVGKVSVDGGDDGGEPQDLGAMLDQAQDDV